MAGVDDILVEQARPHFVDALATFGRAGDDPGRVAEEIAKAAAVAGLPAGDSLRLLKLLREFITLLERRSALGRPIFSGPSCFRSPNALRSQSPGRLVRRKAISASAGQGRSFRIVNRAGARRASPDRSVDRRDPAL